MSVFSPDSVSAPISMDWEFDSPVSDSADSWTAVALATGQAFSESAAMDLESREVTFMEEDEFSVTLPIPVVTKGKEPPGASKIPLQEVVKGVFHRLRLGFQEMKNVSSQEAGRAVIKDIIDVLDPGVKRQKFTDTGLNIYRFIDFGEGVFKYVAESSEDKDLAEFAQKLESVLALKDATQQYSALLDLVKASFPLDEMEDRREYSRFVTLLSFYYSEYHSQRGKIYSALYENLFLASMYGSGGLEEIKKTLRLENPDWSRDKRALNDFYRILAPRVVPEMKGGIDSDSSTKLASSCLKALLLLNTVLTKLEWPQDRCEGLITEFFVKQHHHLEKLASAYASSFSAVGMRQFDDEKVKARIRTLGEVYEAFLRKIQT